jgi:hypothetical protein
LKYLIVGFSGDDSDVRKRQKPVEKLRKITVSGRTVPEIDGTYRWVLIDLYY